MLRTRPNKSRRGFAMLLVIVFLVVLLSMLGIAYRQMATTLRIEEARSRQIERDHDSLQMAVLGLNMLEGSMATNSFESTQSFTTVDGTKTYTLILQKTKAATSDSPEEWTVDVVSGSP